MKNTSTFKGKFKQRLSSKEKKLTIILRWWYIFQNVVFAESHTKVLPWQNLAPETITVKALKIVIFGKDKNCQTKPVTETSLQTLSEEWP